MLWHKSESTVKPLSVDDSCSKVLVYLHKNIQEETRTAEDGTTTTWYVYDEATVPKDDYYEIAACMTDVTEQTEVNTSGIEENSAAVLDVADLADENSTSIEDLADLYDDLLTRVEELEGK